MLDSSKLKEFADDNFRFAENCRKFSNRIENTVRKGKIASYEQFLIFPMFSKVMHTRTNTCLRWKGSNSDVCTEFGTNMFETEEQ